MPPGGRAGHAAAVSEVTRSRVGVAAAMLVGIIVARSVSAVTSELARSEANTGVVLGHPYRALADFETGRFAYCKVAGRPDAPADPRVTTPRECGG